MNEHYEFRDELVRGRIEISSGILLLSTPPNWIRDEEAPMRRKLIAEAERYGEA